MVEGSVVGRVAGTYIYPVVGMNGSEMLDGIEVRYHSVVRDREFAFSATTGPKSRSAHTIVHTMDVPELLQFRAHFADYSNIEKSEVYVRTPNGEVLDIRSEQLRKAVSEVCKYNVELTTFGRTAGYGSPVSVISERTMRGIESRLAPNEYLFPDALRMNIVIGRSDSYSSDRANKEAEWLQWLITFGKGDDRAIVYAQREIKRCAAVNYYPLTHQRLLRNDDILKVIPQDHPEDNGKYLGIGATIMRNGWIRPGDEVILKRNLAQDF